MSCRNSPLIELTDAGVSSSVCSTFCDVTTISGSSVSPGGSAAGATSGVIPRSATARVIPRSEATRDLLRRCLASLGMTRGFIGSASRPVLGRLILQAGEELVEAFVLHDAVVLRRAQGKVADPVGQHVDDAPAVVRRLQ